MGIWKNIFANKQEAAPVVETEKNTVYTPVSGTVIPLEEIADGVFSEGVLGRGCGIRPDSEVVAAPFDGTVILVADTKHAIGVKSSDGVELMIHVGMDTVTMEGAGFNILVKAEERVRCGQKLMTFDRKAIAAADLEDTVAVIVTNSSSYGTVDLMKTGSSSIGEKLIVVK